MHGLTHPTLGTLESHCYLFSGLLELNGIYSVVFGYTKDFWVCI